MARPIRLGMKISNNTPSLSLEIPSLVSAPRSAQLGTVARSLSPQQGWGPWALGEDRFEARESRVEGRFEATESRVELLLSQIRALLRGIVHRWKEKEILELLRSTNAEELNGVMAALDLERLFSRIDDHWGGAKNRTALENLVSRDRLADLTPSNRARIIDALQTGWTDYQAERTIAAIIQGTRGAALTALKNAIDSGGDRHHLMQLLYADIDSLEIRAPVLKHIFEEGLGVKNRELKILSDIDDTFYVQANDKSFPKGTVYPGVRQLYAELDRGLGSGRKGDLGFLTARPGVPGGFMDAYTQRMLHRHGITDAMVLKGSFRGLVSKEAMAKKKIENFNRYADLYPEYGMVFIGDSGEGDFLAAQAMRKHERGQLKRAYIHDVVATPEKERKEAAKQGIIFFDSYLSVATDAYRSGMISAEGVRRVLAQTRKELEAIDFDSEAQKKARWAEFEKAAAEAGDALEESLAA